MYLPKNIKISVGFGGLSHIRQGVLANLFYRFIAVLLNFLVPQLCLACCNSNIGNRLGAVGRLFTCLCLLRTKINLTAARTLCHPITVRRRRAIDRVLTTASRCCHHANALCTLVIITVNVICPVIIRFALPHNIILLCAVLCNLPSIADFFIRNGCQLLVSISNHHCILDGLRATAGLVSNVNGILILVLARGLLTVRLLCYLYSVLPVPIVL